MHPNIHDNVIYSNQDKGATLMSINKWIKQMWYTYTM